MSGRWVWVILPWDKGEEVTHCAYRMKVYVVDVNMVECERCCTEPKERGQDRCATVVVSHWPVHGCSVWLRQMTLPSHKT